MPAERATARGELPELVAPGSAGEMLVQPDAADTEVAERPQVRVALVTRDGNHAAQAGRMAPQRIGDQAVVGAVHADLDHHAEVEARGVQHGHIGVGSRRRRGVAARTDERRIGSAADDVGVGVPGASGHDKGPGRARRTRRKADRRRFGVSRGRHRYSPATSAAGAGAGRAVVYLASARKQSVVTRLAPIMKPMPAAKVPVRVTR